LGGLGLVLALGSAALTARLHETSATDNDETIIARVTARLLENSAYCGHRATEEVSSKFLDRYLEMLDGNRIHFLESDIEEFASYRSRLEALTVKRGDTCPAHQIFERFLKRLEQRVVYVQELLRIETFDFTSQDSYQVDRRTAAHPHD